MSQAPDWSRPGQEFQREAPGAWTDLLNRCGTPSRSSRRTATRGIFRPTTPPPFWLADDGTPHDLTFAWGTGAGPFGAKITTVPASGGPVKKDSWRDLDSG
jgi:hypothetical protein